MQKNKFLSCKLHNRVGNLGFTLIELLITIAILGVLLAFAIPAFSDFLRASKGSSISTEFVGDMMRARSEAISGNTCVKICQSANAINGNTATCATSGDDWQRGWILFRVPDCSTTLNNPVDDNVLSVHVGESQEFQLFTTSGTVRRNFVFDPRGVMISAVGPNLTLSYVPDGVTSKHTRSLCVSIAGRVTVQKYAGVSACN